MKDIVLRAMEETDAGGIMMLMNLPGVRFGTLSVPFESLASVRRVMERAKAGAIVAVRDGVILGTTWLLRGSGRTGHAATVVIFVHDDFCGMGIGTALLTAVLDVADNWLGLRRVALTVNADNARAIGLYEKLGFEKEGRLRGDVLRDGVLIDSFAMARLRPGPMIASGRVVG